MPTLTPEEQLALVKRIVADIAPFEPGDGGYQVFTPDEIRALLNMLVAQEARGDRAEFEHEHPVVDYGEKPRFCERCFKSGDYDDRHRYAPKDWQSAVRARYGMEG